MATGWVVLIAVIALLVGAAGAFSLHANICKIISKKSSVNEDMLRMMMASMGQKPSEKRVRQMMQQMKNQGK